MFKGSYNCLYLFMAAVDEFKLPIDMFFNSFSLKYHNALSGLWIKLKKFSMGPLPGERACFRGSEYILFEILE